MEFQLLMYNNSNKQERTISSEQQDLKGTRKPKQKLSALINTFFRNALKSNLDLTSLADTKAGILISINGFILTVSVTASSFIAHNDLMLYAFICIILTSLGSIILAVLSVQPRSKEKLVAKEQLEGYASLLHYQDIASYTPDEYQNLMKKALRSTKASRKEMVHHLHILSTEIKKKYHWLKLAYTFFSLGLIVSASLMIYALMQSSMQNSAQKEDGTSYSKGHFYNIFEPSGATTVDGNKVLIVEDESSARPLKLITFDEKNNVVEIGDLHIPKKLKKMFKKKVEDLEAIVADGHTVYAITSHSLNRSNKEKKSRNKLLMMRYEDESLVNLYTYKHLKEDLVLYKPKIFGMTLLGYNPMNIEALAIQPENHQLYLGFRAPLFQTKAIIVPLKNPHQLFGKQKQQPLFGEPIMLDLGGLGIRAMQYDAGKQGIWIVAGDSGRRISRFVLYFYDVNKKKLTMQKQDIDFGYSEGITLVSNNGERFLFCVEDNGEKPNKAATYIRVKMD